MQLMGVEPKMYDASKGSCLQPDEELQPSDEGLAAVQRTHQLAQLGSNFTMAFFGPNRQFYEDWQELYSQTGSGLNDSAIQAWQAN